MCLCRIGLGIGRPSWRNARLACLATLALAFAPAASAQLAPPPGAPEDDPAAVEREARAAREEIEAANAKAAAIAAQFKSDAKPVEVSKELKKLTDNLFIDAKNKWVVIDGVVAMREGPPLEMFACLKGTKEHESVVAVPVKAYQVHAALLAIDAKQGKPVQFSPEYKAATGQEIEVRATWKDAKGQEHQVRAQDWIREKATKKPMTHPFVFAGSGFWTDEETGKRYYMAEGGELICVSNFSSAMLDLPVESSQSTEGLLFEAFTERIPPEGTPVRLILIPKAAKNDGEKKSAKEEPPPKQPEPEKGSTDKPAASKPEPRK
ncbi:MAG: hypothetical protein DCC68_22465 [Planctomycetota bacterium]|nr:MAG: hypothetical protein DCC68_22465 [Planctomycetota bacterium]